MKEELTADKTRFSAGKRYMVPIFMCVIKECQHQWVARTMSVPKVCPKCHRKVGVMRLQQAKAFVSS